jgi:dihydroorotase
LETALAVAITYLQRPGLIDWLKLFAMMTTHPARVLMQALVPFQIDHNPDLIVINPEQPWIPTPKLLHSRTQNCPFFGRLLFGKVKMTFIKGKLLYQDHTT